MKKTIILLTLSVITLANSHAQNIFPIIGNVGVGTITPQNQLDVISGSAGIMNKGYYEMASFERNGDAKLGVYSSLASGGGAALVVGSSRKTLLNGHYPGFEFQYVSGSLNASQSSARFNFIERDATGLVIGAQPDILTLYGNGNVGIGTTDTKGYRLAVNGSAIFTSAKVKSYAAWPDYVFDANYALPSLADVETYIKTHKHLPDVTSADEAKKEGLDLGSSQAQLLKKIEELTLYMIEMNKKVERLQQENAALKTAQLNTQK